MSVQPPVSNTIKFKHFQSEDRLSSGVTVEMHESLLVKILKTTTQISVFDSRFDRNTHKPANNYQFLWHGENQTRVWDVKCNGCKYNVKISQGNFDTADLLHCFF